ncbi:MAG: NAD(P)-dependent oxidoreductase [Undibacterium sp.]|uniref:NAD(P)-dependent oxidoreductase n=1 Tax=Undibacterium sp. TaxID=1914977 RepID=UPI00271FD50E|nr:NAD(P)-dependent oxidoreductase [Undibacterium sp.]MDO8651944.1 NAD(P)-dependent oxidoreductase [Undibacterium sp.]
MPNQKTALNISFLGLGLMGKPMASRLFAAGYQLTVWNRTASKAQPFANLGVAVAETPCLAVRSNGISADIIFTMLEAGSAVNDVVRNILPVLKAGAILVDMSSTQQSEAKNFNTLLSEHHVGFIDAPVSGGVLGAESGTLAIMAGAHQHHYDQLESILKIFGRPTRVGLPGSGQLAKLCNQLIVGGTINIVAEALLLAQAGGADPVAVRNALRGGFAESRILEVHGQRMLDRNFIPGGQVKSQAKDMENILLAAQTAVLHLPMAEIVANIYRSLMPQFAQADHSAGLLALEQRNSGIRLGTEADILPPGTISTTN